MDNTKLEELLDKDTMSKNLESLAMRRENVREILIAEKKRIDFLRTQLLQVQKHGKKKFLLINILEDFLKCNLNSPRIAIKHQKAMEAINAIIAN